MPYLTEFLLEVVSTVLFIYLYWEILETKTTIAEKQNYLKYTINDKFGSELANGILISFSRGMNIVELMDLEESPVGSLELSETEMDLINLLEGQRHA